MLSVVAGPVFLLLIPIFDMTLVTVMRLLAGRSPYQGGRDHSSHRLVALGLPEPTAVAVCGPSRFLAACLGLAVQVRHWNWMGVPALIFLIAMVIFAVYLARIRVYERFRNRQPSGYASSRGLHVQAGEWRRFSWTSV